VDEVEATPADGLVLSVASTEAPGRVSSPTREATRRERSERRRRWWVCLIALFGCMAAWSLASPLMAPPDEAAHLYRAVSVVRGHFFGKPLPNLPDGHANPLVAAPVPAPLADAESLFECYMYDLSEPASCAPSLHGPKGVQEVTIANYVGRYPPLYYLIVGLPSLAFPSKFGVYLMRLWSALLCAIFLASAFESLRAVRKKPLLVLGGAVAVTPMVLYLGGSINPNALEISSAFCLWASGLALVVDDRPGVDRRVLARAAVAATVMVEMRGSSPFWLALIGAVLLVLSSRQRLGEILRDRATWCWAAVVGASTLFAVWWILRYQSLDLEVPGGIAPAPKSLPLDHEVSISLGTLDTLVRSSVGALGRAPGVWTPAPSLTIYLWLAAVAVIVGLGAIMGRRREALVLGALIVLFVAVPMFENVINAKIIGFGWQQGRYSLPWSVGIPLVAAAALPLRQLTKVMVRRMRTMIPIGLAVSQATLFLWGLWRYGVGETNPNHPYSGRLDPFAGWQPPLGSFVDFVIFAVALSVYSVWLMRSVRLDGVPAGEEPSVTGSNGHDAAGSGPQVQSSTGDLGTFSGR
jgi:Predicted membrane protein (DUF2142)